MAKNQAKVERQESLLDCIFHGALVSKTGTSLNNLADTLKVHRRVASRRLIEIAGAVWAGSRALVASILAKLVHLHEVVPPRRRIVAPSASFHMMRFP